jgi:hypothetical protein
MDADLLRKSEQPSGGGICRLRAFDASSSSPPDRTCAFSGSRLPVLFLGELDGRQPSMVGCSAAAK